MAVDEGLMADINMGLPQDKIHKNGGGSSLLRGEILLRRSCDRCAVDVPVTGKLASAGQIQTIYFRFCCWKMQGAK